MHTVMSAIIQHTPFFEPELNNPLHTMSAQQDPMFLPNTSALSSTPLSERPIPSFELQKSSDSKVKLSTELISYSLCLLA